MKNNFDITPFIEIILSLLSLVITGFVIPFLKEKLSLEKYNRIKAVVNTAVEAAEQLYKSGNGESKKDYVIAYLKEKGIVLNETELDAMIESHVFSLKRFGS